MSGPVGGTSKNVAISTVTPSVGLNAVWTLPRPGSELRIYATVGVGSRRELTDVFVAAIPGRQTSVPLG